MNEFINTNVGVLIKKIIYTGLQKGEKIHEELFIGDNITNTEHPMILEAKENFPVWSEVEEILAKLKSWHNLSKEEKRELLLRYSVDREVGEPNRQG